MVHKDTKNGIRMSNQRCNGVRPRQSSGIKLNFHPYGKSVKGNCKVVPVDGTGDGVDELRGNHIHGEPA